MHKGIVKVIAIVVVAAAAAIARCTFLLTRRLVVCIFFAFLNSDVAIKFFVKMFDAIHVNSQRRSFTLFPSKF